jgi:hypothetical protein
MLFVSFENRARIKYVSEVQADLLDSLGRKEVRAGLGCYAGDLVAAAETLYVPNVRNDRVTIPRSYENRDDTPCVGIKPREKLKIDPKLRAMSPAQITSLGRTVHGLAPEAFDYTAGEMFAKEISDGFARATHTFKLEDDGYGEAFCNSSTATRECSALPDPHKLRTQSRLIIAMVMKDRSTLDNQMIAVHELTHVMQSQKDPLMPIDKESYLEKVFRNELEATMVSVQFFEPLEYRLYGNCNTYLDFQRETEDIRRAAAITADPFHVAEQAAREILMDRTGMDYYLEMHQALA